MRNEGYYPRQNGVSLGAVFALLITIGILAACAVVLFRPDLVQTMRGPAVVPTVPIVGGNQRITGSGGSSILSPANLPVPTVAPQQPAAQQNGDAGSVPAEPAHVVVIDGNDGALERAVVNTLQPTAPPAMLVPANKVGVQTPAQGQRVVVIDGNSGALERAVNNQLQDKTP